MLKTEQFLTKAKEMLFEADVSVIVENAKTDVLFDKPETRSNAELYAKELVDIVFSELESQILSVRRKEYKQLLLKTVKEDLLALHASLLEDLADELEATA
jgi:hypothetical protein